MTKTIIHYWSDQTTSISDEPQMIDESGYPITTGQAKAWCTAHGYEWYVVEAAGDYGSYISEKSEHAVLPPRKKVQAWEQHKAKLLAKNPELSGLI